MKSWESNDTPTKVLNLSKSVLHYLDHAGEMHTCSVDVEEIDYIIMVCLFLKLKTNFICMTKVLVLLIKLVYVTT